MAEKPPTSGYHALLPWLWLALPLGYLWFRLLDNLRLGWLTDPDYSYGFVVPFLMLGLLVRRWDRLSPGPRPWTATNPWLAVLPSSFLAFLYLPTSLAEAATPEWRPLQWLLGVETVGLTLYAIYLVGGRYWLRQAAFPIGFLFLAIPWPTLIEQPIIQGLSHMNAAAVVDVLFCLNVPALQHGNVIEVCTGSVGINDACSGIRSLQSSLMMSLFLGEFYRINRQRRVVLLITGFALAMFLNICRASLLTWLVAKKGLGAIAEYHDEAGLTILLICSALLWGMSLLFARGRSPAGSVQAMKISFSAAISQILADESRRAVNFGRLLGVWLVLAESGVGLWYHIRESHLTPGPDWTIQMPRNDPTYRDIPLTKEENTLLRFDRGMQGKWQDADGKVWQVFYFNWLPGRLAGYLAKRHTPDICMTAAGYKMLSGPELVVLDVNQIELPMRHYVFSSSEGLLQVYQCRWEPGMSPNLYTAKESARFNLVRGIWAGRGVNGQKVLEIAVTGYNSPELAKQALVRQLETLIKVGT